MVSANSSESESSSTKDRRVSAEEFIALATSHLNLVRDTQVSHTRVTVSTLVNRDSSERYLVDNRALEQLSVSDLF